jgi:hypothetical protein
MPSRVWLTPIVVGILYALPMALALWAGIIFAAKELIR